MKCEYCSAKIKSCETEGKERYFGKGLKWFLCDTHFKLVTEEIVFLEGIPDKKFAKHTEGRRPKVWTEKEVSKAAKEFGVSESRMTFRLVELGLI